MTVDGAHPWVEVSDTATDAYRARREMLHVAVLDLEGVLDALERQARPDRARFRAALERMHTTLRAHVAEADAPESLLAQIIDAAPWTAPRTQKLHDEHDVLLAECGALLERTVVDDPIGVLLTDARRFAESVSRHRHRATALLIDAYLLDVPAAD